MKGSESGRQFVVHSVQSGRQNVKGSESGRQFVLHSVQSGRQNVLGVNPM